MNKKQSDTDVANIVDFIETELIAELKMRLVKLTRSICAIEGRPRARSNRDRLQWYLDELTFLEELIPTEEAKEAIARISRAQISAEKRKKRRIQPICKKNVKKM